MSGGADTNFLAEDDFTGNRSDRRALGYLLRFAAPWRWQFLASFALLVISSATTMASGFLLGMLIDEVLGSASTNSLLLFSSLFIACECAALITLFIGRRMLATYSSLALLHIRKALFGHMHALPLRYYDRQPHGRTVTRMTHDVEGLEEFFTMSAGRIGMSIIMIICCMAAMLLTDFSLGMILVGSMLPALIATAMSRTQARDLQRQMAVDNSAINARLAEYISGHSVIRNFGLETWSLAQFNKRVLKYFSSCIDLNNFNAVMRPSVEMLCTLPLLFLILFGGKLVLAGSLTLGIFVAFVRYCDQFLRPVSQLSREIHILQQAFTSIERVAHLLQAPTETQVLGENGNVGARNLDGRIEFKSVTMGYEAEVPVLNDLSFRIESGERIGLLGRTGSGKTSTVSILTRLYEFQAGEVLLDGLSIRCFDRASLRGAIGFVSQDVTIFRGTVFENLNDDGRYSAEQVEDAARQTGLFQVLSRAGLNFQAELLDKGANISVGERQLIALTRVLLKQPRILILDEATANVDPELERIIHHAVDLVMRGRTCLIIAHRLDTLKNCDKLLVFHDGRIVEQGPHDSLLAANGYYQGLLAGNS